VKSNTSKFIIHQQMAAMVHYKLGHHWHNLLFLDFVYCIIFIKKTQCLASQLCFRCHAKST